MIKKIVTKKISTIQMKLPKI